MFHCHLVSVGIGIGFTTLLRLGSFIIRMWLLVGVIVILLSATYGVDRGIASCFLGFLVVMR